MDIYNLISLAGIAVIFLVAYGMSTDRKAVNWHIVLWGVGLQMLIAWFLFLVPAGIAVFQWLNKVVIELLRAATAGAEFIFGRLAVPPGETSTVGEASLGFIFAFQIFPAIIFFSALVSILYYWRVIPRIVQAMAFLFTRLMKVSGAEALCTASNIFVGVESVVAVRPYLRKMTRSELCTILTAGMATVSSNVLAIYVFSLRDVFPNIGGHLISASLLSAPAALAVSKVLLPETEVPQTLGEHVTVPPSEERSIFEAVINGAMAGVKLIVGIVALLIAVLGLVALMDQMLAYAGSVVTPAAVDGWSLTALLKWIFYPFAFLMGIDPRDVALISELLAERVVLTEIASYQHLAVAIDAGQLHSPRSAFVVTYALCGFAHVASMAIFVGGVAALVPERTRDLAGVAWRSLLAASLACLLTGCIAGLFYMTGTHPSVMGL